MDIIQQIRAAYVEAETTPVIRKLHQEIDTDLEVSYEDVVDVAREQNWEQLRDEARVRAERKEREAHIAYELGLRRDAAFTNSRRAQSEQTAKMSALASVALEVLGPKLIETLANTDNLSLIDLTKVATTINSLIKTVNEHEKTLLGADKMALDVDLRRAAVMGDVNAEAEERVQSLLQVFLANPRLGDLAVINQNTVDKKDKITKFSSAGYTIDLEDDKAKAFSRLDKMQGEKS